jgi:hypothetical protein
MVIRSHAERAAGNPDHAVRRYGSLPVLIEVRRQRADRPA